MFIKMLTLVLCLLALFGYSNQAEGKHWALLVAGSNSYFNYRHQADVCHSYHVVRNHGIPPERIVTMMYDDIANNIHNPFKGNIINEPNGTNVYEGVVKDYTGSDVNPDVFLKVLSGDSAGVQTLLGRKGKVIDSGPNDRVFVFFADHGAVGLLCFPKAYLHASDLKDVLVKMHQNKKYRQMVFYVEACYSGSMFYNNILPDDINVYATTAANADESSYAYYFDTRRMTFLADVYSIKWMQDSDKRSLKTETLEGQFQLVKRETLKSHVSEYGDKTVASLSVGDFQGNLTDNVLRFRTHKYSDDTREDDAVKSEDVALEILKRTNNKKGLDQFMRRRDATQKFFQEMVELVSNFDYVSLAQMPVYMSNHECYKAAVNELTEQCPGMKPPHNYDALKNFKILAHLCEMNIDTKTMLRGIRAVASISNVCLNE